MTTVAGIKVAAAEVSHTGKGGQVGGRIEGDQEKMTKIGAVSLLEDMVGALGIGVHHQQNDSEKESGKGGGRGNSK